MATMLVLSKAGGGDNFKIRWAPLNRHRNTFSFKPHKTARFMAVVALISPLVKTEMEWKKISTLSSVHESQSTAVIRYRFETIFMVNSPSKESFRR
jgi:predicted component of type VI protein secretion system